MPRLSFRFPLRRWIRSWRFWTALPFVLSVLMFSGIFVVGQVLARMMENPDARGLQRESTVVSWPDAGSVELSFLLSGERLEREGTPIVYVHGTPGDATNFASFVRKPVGGRFSVAIDRPGFGKSRDDRAFVSFAEQARAVVAILDALHIERAILVGHSLGGPIVARAAAEFPDRVAGIVEVAGSLDPDLEKLEWYNSVLGWWPLTKLLPGSFIRSNDEVLAARQQCMELAEVLADVRCPVLILHGTQDRLVPYSNVDYMLRVFTAASRVELRTLDGADHFVPWAQEDQMRKAVAEMSEWVDSPAAAASAKSSGQL